jgi:general secretion pathway protein M
MTSPVFLTRLRTPWQALAPREQTLVLGATAVVLLALLWWVGMGPALKVLRQAEAQKRSLDTELQRMQAMASEAQALKARPAIPYIEALRALEASVKTGLGAGAQFNVAGERATVTLKNVPADALAQWLGQARMNARTLPGEARLTRGAAPAGGAATWDGTLVMNLPPR